MVNQRRITTELVDNVRSNGPERSFDRYERERREPPRVPEYPPYRAFIRNIPREATDEDIAGIFGDYEVDFVICLDDSS